MTVPLPGVFQRRTLTPGGIRINTLVGGTGSPVLLLHGYPQPTSCGITWPPYSPNTTPLS